MSTILALLVVVLTLSARGGRKADSLRRDAIAL
jgi:hypothetical protein